MNQLVLSSTVDANLLAPHFGMPEPGEGLTVVMHCGSSGLKVVLRVAKS